MASFFLNLYGDPGGDGFGINYSQSFYVIYNIAFIVSPQGFEPQLSEPESEVLPLHHRESHCDRYCKNRKK
jgi:hypothetical protein